jgi:1-phosphofructokinase
VLPADGEPFEVVPQALPHGFREGCGDSMMGAIAAGWARGLSLRDSVRLGAAAGSANFLRHGLGTGSREVVEEMVHHVVTRPYTTVGRVSPGQNGQMGSSPRTIA